MIFRYADPRIRADRQEKRLPKINLQPANTSTAPESADRSHRKTAGYQNANRAFGDHRRDSEKPAKFGTDGRGNIASQARDRVTRMNRAKRRRLPEIDAPGKREERVRKYRRQFPLAEEIRPLPCNCHRHGRRAVSGGSPCRKKRRDAEKSSPRAIRT